MHRCELPQPAEGSTLLAGHAMHQQHVYTFNGLEGRLASAKHRRHMAASIPCGQRAQETTCLRSVFQQAVLPPSMQCALAGTRCHIIQVHPAFTYSNSPDILCRRLAPASVCSSCWTGRPRWCLPARPSHQGPRTVARFSSAMSTSATPQGLMCRQACSSVLASAMWDSMACSGQASHALCWPHAGAVSRQMPLPVLLCAPWLTGA